jgi:hypothetical protein
LVSYRGKICCCTHHTFLLGFPTGWSSCPHQAIFSYYVIFSTPSYPNLRHWRHFNLD